MGSVLREVVIDCREPQVVASFWAEVLGWPLVADPRGFCWLSATGDLTAQAPLLVFVPVPEPKAAKNRLHLDLAPSGCDQQEEVGRLLALGARRVDIGQGNAGWIVLADPEGNEFCMLAHRAEG
ncbi:MAG: VOC family protein [Frankiaceae bacterium]